ncbi:MAG: L-threonylcarbamoyladenylate synthase [Acidimicrobiales bacterium]
MTVWPGRLVPLAPDAEGLALAVAALESGSVVGVPTDTVYGLAVDPTHPGAVDQLFALKQRPTDVALPVLVDGPEHLSLVAGSLDSAARHLAERYWPGPLTLVVPRRRGFTVDLGGPRSSGQTVGVRWPDHDLVRRLCRSLGPLAVTSANLHGARPATSAQQVADAFEGSGALAVVLDGGRCEGIPSTVVECRGPAFRCLREGAIPWADLHGRDQPRPTPRTDR